VYMETNPIVGKRIVAVYIADDKMALRFDLEDGTSVIARTDGDCCSHSWVESVEGPERLLGVVQSAQDINMPDLGTPPEHECLSYYGYKITTDKGDCIIDYRNSSNGYYGGWLVWPSEGYNRLYGGVHGQNKSEEKWGKLA
jgi:hypothetical protein